MRGWFQKSHFDTFQCFGTHSHGGAKKVFEESLCVCTQHQSHHLKQTFGFTHHLSWPGHTECCLSKAAGAPGKPGEDLPEIFCEAAQVLWQFLGLNPPPQCSLQQWLFGTWSQKETLGTADTLPQALRRYEVPHCH